MMDLRRLRYFVAIAEEGNLTRAAARLGLQQPPLSQSISAFERELGVRLFRRLPRGMALTEPGRILLAEAKAIFYRLEQARLSTLRAGRGELGKLVVGVTNSAPFHPLVPQTIRDFAAANPLIGLSMEEGGTGELVEALRRETIDVAFMRTPLGASHELSSHLVLSEEMVVALPAGHRFSAEQEALHLGLLSDETFIIYRRPSGPGLHDAIVAACHSAGFSPAVGAEAPRIVATVNLVASGLGIAIVPASLGRMHLDDVVYRGLSGAPALRAPLFLTWRKADASQIVRRFVSLVRRQPSS